MYAGRRLRQSCTALSKAGRSSRNTAMPIAASVMISSQLPFVVGRPLSRIGRYTERRVAPNFADWAAGHTVDVCLMISAARENEAPDQPVCSGALWLVCCLIVAPHAFM